VKVTCENGHSSELGPQWRGDEIGHYLVPYEIIGSKRAFSRILVKLWGITALVSGFMYIYLYDINTVEGIVGGVSMFLVFAVSTWQWMSKLKDYPDGLGWFAITPEEALSMLKLKELSDGSWEVKVKRHKIRHVADVEPFREVRKMAEERLHVNG
jgi:hypothetical protein